MRNLSGYLLSIGIAVMSFYAIYAAQEWAGERFGRFYRGYMRKIGAEQYMQSVLLPLYGAFVGGLLSTGIAFLFDPPSGGSSQVLGCLLLAAALAFGVMVPLRTSLTYENRKKLLTGLRIDQLKKGDWERDSKADVLKTIQEDRAARDKQSRDLNALFLISLAFLIGSDADWFVFYRPIHSVTAIVETLVILAAASGVAARYWIWPKALRSAYAELDSQQAEAEKLSPPSPAGAAAANHRHNHDLWMAVGGLIIGAILTRVGDLFRRSEH